MLMYVIYMLCVMCGVWGVVCCVVSLYGDVKDYYILNDICKFITLL